jgi:TonB family protein
MLNASAFITVLLVLAFHSVVANSQANCTPKAIAKPAAEYTKKLVRAGVEGTVYFQFRVLPDGSVTDIRSLEHSRKEFVPLVLERVKEWRFEPHACGGDSGVVLGSEMRFSLDYAPSQDLEDLYQGDADIVRARHLLEWARIIEAYHKKSGHCPLQRRVEGEEAIRVRIATREQQTQLNRARDNPGVTAISVKEFVADIEAVLEREIDERYDPQRVSTGPPTYLSYFATKNGYLISAVCRTCPPRSDGFTVRLPSGVSTINIGSSWFVENVGKTQSIDSLQAHPVFVEFIGKGPTRGKWFEHLEREQVHESKK